MMKEIEYIEEKKGNIYTIKNKEATLVSISSWEPIFFNSEQAIKSVRYATATLKLSSGICLEQ